MLGRVTVTSPSRWLRPAALVLGVLALAAALAALGGWWWWKWWSPAPKGQIFQKVDGTYAWYATPLDPGQAHVAASTFEYVVVGFLLALVVGAVAGVVGRKRSCLTLMTLVLASALGAWLMYRVGVSLGPPAPSQWANRTHLGRSFLGNLSVAHHDLRLWSWLAHVAHDDDHVVAVPTPCLVWPVGALLAFNAIMLGIAAEKPTAATSDSKS